MTDTPDAGPDFTTDSTAAAPDSADAIRAEIEQTRADLGHAVDQLADKLNVKAQAGAKLDGLKSSAADAVAATRPHRAKIAAAAGAVAVAVIGFVVRRARSSR